ncbi:hypothetical protein BDAP_002895 [Binucleata daphniae]
MEYILTFLAYCFASVGSYNGIGTDINNTLSQTHNPFMLIENNIYEPICVTSFSGNLVRNPNVVMLPKKKVYEPFIIVCNNYTVNLKNLEREISKEIIKIIKKYKQIDDIPKLQENNLNNQITEYLYKNIDAVGAGQEDIENFIDKLTENLDQMSFESDLYNEMRLDLKKKLKNLENEFKRNREENCDIKLVPLAVTAKTRTIIDVVQNYHKTFGIFFDNYGILLSNAQNIPMDDLICANPKIMNLLSNEILTMQKNLDELIDMKNSAKIIQKNVDLDRIKINFPSNEPISLAIKTNIDNILTLLQEITNKNNEVDVEPTKLAYSYYSAKIDFQKSKYPQFTQHPNTEKDTNKIGRHENNIKKMHDGIKNLPDHEQMKIRDAKNRDLIQSEGDKNHNEQHLENEDVKDVQNVVDTKNQKLINDGTKPYINEKCRYILRCMLNKINDMYCRIICAKYKENKKEN